MSRPVAAALVLGVMGLVAALFVDVDTDARILGADSMAAAALDTPQGRHLTLAVIGPDRTARAATLGAIAEALEGHPGIAWINTGPEPPDDALIDWLWQNRLRLAPPPAEAFQAEAMADQLRAARDAMTSAHGAAFGARLLADPLGSFKHLLDRAGTEGQLEARDGIWQARDDTAAIAFAAFPETAYDETGTLALIADAKAAFEASRADDQRFLIMGARAISARVGARIAEGATWTGVLSGVALLFWLAWIARRPVTLALCLLPLGIGLVGATLTVQIAFGSIHAVALGFGGALTGLALDYPLHMMAHSRDRRWTARLVVTSSATTALAFAALLGTGLPALAQIGTFVAAGLVFAALASLWLGQVTPTLGLRTPPAARLIWPIPHRTAVYGVIAVVGGILLTQWDVLRSDPAQIITLPESVTGDLADLRAMVDLPDERHMILLGSGDAEAALQAGEKLAPVLSGLAQEGVIGTHRMLADWLPSQARQSAPLPPPSDVLDTARTALQSLGMRPAFAETIAAEYAAARNSPPVTLTDLGAFPALAPATGLIGPRGGLVLLTKVDDPARLSQSIAALNDPEIRLIDVKAGIRAGLVSHRDAALRWLAGGALGACALLLLMAPRRARVPDVALTVAASLALTVGITATAFGGLDLFQIVALTLVTGIGVDYALFMRMAPDRTKLHDAAGSVGLCAVSTLIAFGIMAFSSVKLLSGIGTTVVCGVVFMLALSFASQSDETMPESHDR